ncbi:MAG: type II toxin-antitoxin system RelE/ParE family toxin [Spirochaetia bacterium]|nr:type II toxin-antitoxin system RelE/ParE family toxin [Spirochaetia bacterium]
MREIEFYETENGIIPIKDFLDKQDIDVVKKISWTLKYIKDQKIVPSKFFKKLRNDIWEIRVKNKSDIYRILCFWDKNNLIILTHGIVKKTQETPKKEIKLAQIYRKDYFRRKK